VRKEISNRERKKNKGKKKFKTKEMKACKNPAQNGKMSGNDEARMGEKGKWWDQKGGRTL
jgi:hypothetical protein